MGTIPFYRANGGPHVSQKWRELVVSIQDNSFINIKMCVMIIIKKIFIIFPKHNYNTNEIKMVVKQQSKYKEKGQFHNLLVGVKPIVWQVGINLITNLDLLLTIFNHCPRRPNRNGYWGFDSNLRCYPSPCLSIWKATWPCWSQIARSLYSLTWRPPNLSELALWLP